MASADPRRKLPSDKKATDAMAETQIQGGSTDPDGMDPNSSKGTASVPAKPSSARAPGAPQTPRPAAAPPSKPAATAAQAKSSSPPKQDMPKEPAGKESTGNGGAGAEAKKSKRLTQLGDFRLEKKLGQGGMGTVFLATQISLDRKVALKTLSPEFAKKEQFVARFLREARSMARLQHPNVVQVYAADTVSGVNYAAIEFIDGRSMQGWMDELKQLEVGDALHVILVCGDALKHAHDQNMIHRDIKPDNILVTKKGVVKVADFGLAKALDEDVSMTQSGTGMGTPLYMAPEQARNAKHVDKRSDIYSLGCTLYYFLTGKLPFTGSNTMEVIVAKEKGTFPHARKLNPKVSERLDLIIDKMLMKDPQYRYADCGEILHDLGNLGLASPSLTFIETATGIPATVNPAVAAVSTVNVSRQQTSRPSGSVASQPPGKRPASPSERLTSAEDAARSAARAPIASGKTWYVQHTGADGRPVISKMSTVEVLAGIKGETLDVAAKAKDSPNGSFHPLIQYAEFESLASKRAVKAEAEAKSRKTQAIYEKLDRQEQRRKRWRWLRNLGSNVKNLVVFLIYLAILIIVCGVGWWAFTHMDQVRGMIGGKAKAEAPAQP
jgi:eukaryotic-like serine/threonine-protein kinase